MNLKVIPYKSPKFIISTLLLVSAGALFCTYQNNHLTVSHTTYVNDTLPEAFNNFKIVQISDLHNKSFGKSQGRLLGEIQTLSPDAIFITGDLIDRRRFNLNKAMRFIQGATQLAPVYYVAGNHEAWSGHYTELRTALLVSGVTLLDDCKITLTRDDSQITLLGLSDPDFLTSSYQDGTDVSKVSQLLEAWHAPVDFQILLSHRPELFFLYTKSEVDLVFTGHAHGGQFRLPGIGGLFAPDQGFLPQYTNGRHTTDATTMFVSRGLGNSLFPLRLFNPPEIVCVTLNKFSK
ncbi:MAG: metallophosphoesterase [Cellulosilyticaceae bacterium]